jgi:glycosyltransferase involved in cell wall biosynthesis
MGIDHLLHAVRDVTRNGREVELIIGGEGPLKTELESSAKRLGLKTTVRFEGYIPDERLPTYYQAADFFLLPTKALEGFGLVVVEALACGTPVLGTPVGAIPEILGELQPDLLFEGTRPEPIASGILKHLERAQADPQGYEALRRRCREYATARFGWDRIVERLEKELLNIIGKG